MKTTFNLHFYNLLFKPTPTHNQSGPARENQKLNIFKYFSAKLFRLSKAFFSILRCPFLEKNKILFFNHSQRTRKNKDLSRSPLYLNEEVFNQNLFHFIDNHTKKIPFYHKPKAILNSSHIDELFSILGIPSRILNKFKKKSLTQN